MTYTDALIPPSSQPKPKLRREATTGGYTVTVCGVLSVEGCTCHYTDVLLAVRAIRGNQ